MPGSPRPAPRWPPLILAAQHAIELADAGLLPRHAVFETSFSCTVLPGWALEAARPVALFMRGDIFPLEEPR